jgi:hypothetical protein
MPKHIDTVQAWVVSKFGMENVEYKWKKVKAHKLKRNTEAKVKIMKNETSE